MHPNEAKLLRVYPRLIGEPALTETVASDSGFEIAIEAKAGYAVFASGGAFALFFTLRDLTDFSIVAKQSIQGHFGADPWRSEILLYAFNEAPPGDMKHQHVYDAIVSMSFGIVNPGTSIYTSRKFVISRP